jgi:MFS family permease
VFNVLLQRNFGLLWIGGLISAIGDWVLFIALPFYVFQMTGSALATGGLFIAQALPRVVLGSVAGVFVDRWDRRRTMIAADLLRTGLMLLLLFVHSIDSLWLVFAVGFLESAISQFFGPAKGALVPQLVGEQELLEANSLNAVSDNLPRLIGPSLGGLLMGIFGIASVVLVDSASYLLSAFTILAIVLPQTPSERAAAGPGAPPGTPTSTISRFLAELKAGLVVIWHDRLLRGCLWPWQWRCLPKGSSMSCWCRLSKTWLALAPWSLAI